MLPNKSCEECCCVDSEENPILEILDESGFIEVSICMMCYVEEVNDAEG